MQDNFANICIKLPSKSKLGSITYGVKHRDTLSWAADRKIAQIGFILAHMKIIVFAFKYFWIANFYKGIDVSSYFFSNKIDYINWHEILQLNMSRLSTFMFACVF